MTFDEWYINEAPPEVSGCRFYQHAMAREAWNAARQQDTELINMLWARLEVLNKPLTVDLNDDIREQVEERLKDAED